MTDNELLLLPEVVARTRLSIATIWRLEAKGKFPKRLKIGTKRIAWRAVDLDRWLADRVAEANRGAS